MTYKRTHKLYLSTAVLALATGNAAVAQEWDLAVHGFFDQHIGYGHNDFDGGDNAIFYNGYREHGDYDEGVSFTNAEIHFTPSVTLEDGMSFGVNIQLEGNNNDPDIDESYMIIKGDRFGKMLLGSTNSAGFKMMVAAPEVTTMPVDSPSISAYIPFSGVYSGAFRQAALTSYTEVSGNNDAQRITYFTPSFNGFVLGASYAPNGYWKDGAKFNSGAFNNGIFDRKRSLNDIFDIGASYDQKWGNTSLSIAGRYGQGTWGKKTVHDKKHPYTWALGGQIGYAGFTFGGSYARNENGLDDNFSDSTGWSAGATYDFAGPWSVEAVTFQGKNDNGPEKEKYHAYRIGAARQIGPGIDFNLYGIYAKANNGYSKSSEKDASLKGWALGSAINLNF